MRAAVAAALLAAALASPASAAIGEADCLWDLVGPAARDELFTGYASGGRESALGAVAQPDIRAAIACTGRLPASPEEERELGGHVGRIWASMLIERAALQRLYERGVGAEALDAAWSKLGPERRSRVRGLWPAFAKGEPADKAGIQAVLDAAEASGWRLRQEAPADLDPFADYFMARAYREALEAE